MAIRTDDTGFGGLLLLQDTESFCYCVYAVLLADAADAAPGDRVLLCNGLLALEVKEIVCRTRKVSAMAWTPCCWRMPPMQPRMTGCWIWAAETAPLLSS